MIAQYKINSRLKDYFHFESLRNFLRPIDGVKSSGTKEELVKHVEEAVNNGTLEYKIFRDYVAQELRYGHHRTYYYLKLNDGVLHRINNLQRVQQSLAREGFKYQEFSKTVEFVPKNQRYDLVHLEIVKTGDHVQKMLLCFGKEIEINRKLEGVEQTISDTDYVWVEIDVLRKQMVVSVRPRGNINDTSSSSFRTFQEVKNFVANTFGLSFLNVEEIKNTLYTLFKEFIKKAEQPYVEQVDPLEKEIEDACTYFAQKLGLSSAKIPVDLPFRFRRLLERALIQEDFSNYKSYSEGKIGAVGRFLYSDETGARVNARADEKGEGIQNCDIYFDTRETIDDQEIFDKLWVTWFVPNGDERKEVKTKIEVTTDYYIIHFYGYHTGGEYEYVFSNLESFKQL